MAPVGAGCIEAAAQGNSTAARRAPLPRLAGVRGWPGPLLSQRGKGSASPARARHCFPPARLAGRAAAPVPPQGLAPPRARGAEQTKGAEAGAAAREEGGGQVANRTGLIHRLPLHRTSPPRPAVKGGGSRAAVRPLPRGRSPSGGRGVPLRLGPLPGHLGGAARPAPAPGLGGELPRGVAERHSPRRRRRRSWLCCCFRGARPGFGFGSLPRRAAASLFLAPPPPPLPPPPLPPPLRPRRGARGRQARDGRRLLQARLRLRRPRTARLRQEGRGHPRSGLRLPGRLHQPSADRLPRRSRAPSLSRDWAPRPQLVPAWWPREIRGGRPGAGWNGGREAVWLC